MNSREVKVLIINAIYRSALDNDLLWIRLLITSRDKLSIDIDIIMPVTPEKLDELLDGVASEQGFLRKELQLNILDQNGHYFLTKADSNPAEYGH